MKFNIHIETDDRDARAALDDLRDLGELKTGRDWSGRAFFDFPAPFSDLRIFDGETLTPEKKVRLVRARRYFFDTRGI